MKHNPSGKRKGFTLVELLIVIVVIGVLSAMMMLSSTEAVSSARASNIVSNLRNLKTATLAWYADHLDSADASGFNLGTNVGIDKIKKYLNNESDTALTGYHVDGTTADTWYVYYDGSDIGNSSVVEKLNARRGSVGIAGTKVKTDYTNANNKITTTGTTAKVYMFVR